MINNSRAIINKKPRDINKKHPGKTYLPRFLDGSNLDNLKSSVDRELADISMHFEQERQIVSKIIPGSIFQGQWDACTDKYPDADEDSTWDVTVSCGASHMFDGKKWEAGQQLLYIKNADKFVQRTSPGTDGIKQIIGQLESEIDNAKSLIEQNKLAVADLNFSLTQLDTKLTAQVGENTSKINQTNQVVSDLTTTVAANKTELESSINDKTAAINQELSTVAQRVTTAEGEVDVLQSKWTVQADVNGKISGIEMVNNGLQSSFNILADRFTVTDGTTVKPPFAIENQKVSMSDVIVRGHIEAGSGSFKGHIEADSGKFKGTVEADSGYFSGELRGASGNFSGDITGSSGNFRGDITGASGTFSGALNIHDQAGNVGMKITNQNILIYDSSGQLRVKIGRL